MSRKVKIVCLSLLSTTPVVTAAISTLDDIRRSNLTWVGGFNRTVCYSRTLDYLNKNILANDSEVFFRDGSGRPMSGKQDITLTLPGCQALCGERQAWYWDIGPRITTWLIPILLLISNVELSPLDKRRFFAIIHLMGDPIDSIWSLVHKIDAWDRCYRLAAEQYADDPDRVQRVIATVFAGFEEIKGPDITLNYLLQTLIMTANPFQEAIYRQWRLAAVELADSRSDEILRTTLAVILYFYHVVASFVEEVGGDQSSPPGGRIGTAMFISWLVPVVLLSNSIGGFTSRRSASSILIRFAQSTGLELDFASRQSTRLRQSTPLEMIISNPLAAFIFCISIAPIVIGMTGSFVIMWHTLPVGFACRHLWIIAVFTLYFVSAFITWASHSRHFATGAYHWHFVLYKDGLIGVTSLLAIFLSSSGAFNSCYCFSGNLYYRGRGRVLLNSDPFYHRKNDTVYPAVVAICLFLELAVFAAMAWIWWNGLQVMRWSEKARAEEWEAAEGGTRPIPGHAARPQSRQQLIHRLVGEEPKK
ncbi:hypothetical protein EPUS_01073 [Endocarpon pusillum Z07020]|uniref:Uncharacterized protein n=1 Tax=Endocarpon pusillum (strain Z07020 / HMAS-L-300199) TaxID=1263415 RepID=U1FWA2_ENDPU|nr:uncharacterized protein EPUS_01073 [Endocarpon pusillum Z07020]ERF69117.1 hypothetical protein EPUS_01073 [Endocarpon pusillum Z07020]